MEWSYKVIHENKSDITAWTGRLGWRMVFSNPVLLKVKHYSSHKHSNHMAVTAWGGKTLATIQSGNKCSTIHCQMNVVKLNWISWKMSHSIHFYWRHRARNYSHGYAYNVKVKLQVGKRLNLWGMMLIHFHMAGSHHHAVLVSSHDRPHLQHREKNGKPWTWLYFPLFSLQYIYIYIYIYVCVCVCVCV